VFLVAGVAVGEYAQAAPHDSLLHALMQDTLVISFLLMLHVATPFEWTRGGPTFSMHPFAQLSCAAIGRALATLLSPTARSCL